MQVSFVGATFIVCRYKSIHNLRVLSHFFNWNGETKGNSTAETSDLDVFKIFSSDSTGFDILLLITSGDGNLPPIRICLEIWNFAYLISIFEDLKIYGCLNISPATANGCLHHNLRQIIEVFSFPLVGNRLTPPPNLNAGYHLTTQVLAPIGTKDSNRAENRPLTFSS